MKPKLINFVLFQISWFACVLGAAAGSLLPGLLAVMALVLYQASRPKFIQRDLPLILVALGIGLFLDSLWIWTGIMRFSLPGPVTGLAPVWILLLWVAFPLTINHSMAWLRSNLPLAALFGAVGSPLSYLAGMRLGALSTPEGIWVMVIAAGISWALVIPLLCYLAGRLAESGLNQARETVLNRYWSWKNEPN